MRRREVITLLGSAAAAWPFAAHAQVPQRMKRVAMIHPATKAEDLRIGGDPNYTIMLEEIKRLGYVEGVNLIVDRYSAEGRFDRFPEIARNVVATRPDVICAVSNALVLALQSETRTIPIVGWTGDPVVAGIISSLAHPGGNITGVSIDAGPDLGAKRVELFVEAVGKIANARVLDIPEVWKADSPYAKSMREAAKRANIPLELEPLQSPINESEYKRAFEAMLRDHVDGVFISPSPDNYTYRVLLGQLAREYKLPAISWFTDSTEAGALMSYAFNLEAADRRIAAQTVEILNGGNPAEMPFFLETHWELVINLKSAKELGLE